MIASVHTESLNKSQARTLERYARLRSLASGKTDDEVRVEVSRTADMSDEKFSVYVETARRLHAADRDRIIREHYQRPSEGGVLKPAMPDGRIVDAEARKRLARRAAEIVMAKREAGEFASFEWVLAELLRNGGEMPAAAGQKAAYSRGGAPVEKYGRPRYLAPEIDTRTGAMG